MRDAAGRVETTPRLAQWRIDHALSSPFGCRKSDSFRMGLWNWCILLERNSKQLCVKLLLEASSAAKETPPIASFIAKIICSSPPNQHPNHKTISHPAIVDRQLKNEGFAWAIDAFVSGRFAVDIEFRDLKVADPSGGPPVSIWGYSGTKESSCSAAISSLGRMLEEGVHVDITIHAADGSVGAHRAVLAARSPVFRSMFSHDLKEKELSTVNISDMSIGACRALLSYVYGRFNLEEFLIHRIALLRAADKYDIADLRKACSESLAEDIDEKNVLERLHIAHLHQLPMLKASCMRYLVDFRKVLELRDDLRLFIQSADRDLIFDIFQSVLAAWNGI